MPTRARSPSLTLFAALSLGLHAAVVGSIRMGRDPSAPTFDEASPPLAGDTLDVEPPALPSEADDPGVDPADSPASPPSPRSPTATEPRPPSPARTPSVASPGASAASSAGSAQAPAVFGAVGVRYATDLATTFTRAFPQAASADAIWSTVPFGTAGSADVVLVLDEGGHLASAAVQGAPTPALRRGLERALTLITPRTFTARRAVTHLHVTARVTRDGVHDGLHGDVFALSGGSFSQDVGSAFFTLPPAGGPGRRIDVELRLLP